MTAPGATLGAQLALTVDKAAAAETAKALEEARRQSEALNKVTQTAAEAELRHAEAEKAAAAATQKAAEAARAKAAATKTVGDVLKEIDRQKTLDNLAAKWAKVARQTKDAAAAQAGLQKELEALNASQGEIQSTASTFAEGGGGPRNRLARVGSELRALPSQQIPGLGIGTDAIGNFLRLGGALGVASEKSSVLLNITAALTPVLGATAAGVGAIVVAAAPFVLAAGAVALALKALGDQAASEAAKINAIIDAQRSVGQDVARGATSEDLQKRLEELNRLREDESQRLDTLKQKYSESVDNANVFGVSISGVVKAVSGAEDALAGQITTSTDNLTKYGTEIDALNNALANGETAANDAAEAEARLAEERTKAVLDSAAAAGQEVQAQNRANKATFEQNEARLQAIEDEKAAIQAQLNVLQSSGDTSEEVTSQIEKLNAQLGSLGKESDYISNVALEASKRRDAEKKAADEAKKAAEKAQRDQEAAEKKRYDAGVKYSDALVDIARKAADTAEDRLSELNSKLGKNELDFSRDITALSVKAGRERLEAEIAAQQKEAADLREHQRKLESIRDDAAKSENEALRKRNFLEAARIREEANAKLEAENKAFEAGQSEKTVAEDEARAKELRELEYARQDRLLALRQQNEDARAAYEEQSRQDEINRARQEREAEIARDRELAAADEILKIKEQQSALEIQIAGQTFAGIAALAQQNAVPQTNYSSSAGSRVTNNNSVRNLGGLNMPIYGAANPAAVQQIVLQTLGQIGFTGN